MIATSCGFKQLLSGRQQIQKVHFIKCIKCIICTHLISNGTKYTWMIVKAGIRLWHRIDSGCHKMSRDWQRGPSLLPNKLLPNGSGMSVVEIVVEIIKVESTHFNRGWNHSAIFVFSNITIFGKILSRLKVRSQDCPGCGPDKSLGSAKKSGVRASLIMTVPFSVCKASSFRCWQ